MYAYLSRFMLRMHYSKGLILRQALLDETSEYRQKFGLTVEESLVSLSAGRLGIMQGRLPASCSALNEIIGREPYVSFKLCVDELIQVVYRSNWICRPRCFGGQARGSRGW